MKCPECVKEGQKSTVRVRPMASTLMYSNDYYDEDGRWHSHDPNWFSRSYRCSRGHEWGTSIRGTCPVDGCDWNRKDDEDS